MLTVLFWLLFSVTLIAVLGVSLIRAHMAQSWGSIYKVIAQMLIFYGVYLIPFFWVWCGWQYLAGDMSLLACLSWSAVGLLYLYARVIEPSMLKVNHYDVTLDPTQPLAKPLKLAVLADIHLGLFSGDQRQLNRIVTRLNAMDDIDAVVFSGDWTYEPGADILGKLMLLSAIKQPCYHVLGNHDEQEPGPDITAELLHALEVLQVKNIEAMQVDLGSVHLIGVGDLWASKAEFSHFSRQDINGKPSVVLAHNPDTVDFIPEGLFDTKPLMISGHTHGGQVYVPLLTHYMFKEHSATGFCQGLYQHDKAQVFVTAGTGMVFLPFRINMPPCIDVLTLT